jgi:hypothetical protein
LYKENVEYKRLLINEIRKGDEFHKQIESFKLDLKSMTEEIKNEELGKAICEKRCLIESVSTVSEEVS